MRILYINRSKKFGGFSFEELFKTIKINLSTHQIIDFYDKTHSSFIKNIQAAKNIPADIIHLTGGLGYYSFFLNSNKTILTIHDTNHYEYDLKGLKKWLFAWLYYKIPYKNTYCLTTVSEHTKSRLIDLFHFKSENIIVVPNCYPSDFIKSIKPKMNSTVKVLQIGTKRNKNLSNLIIALKGIDVELTIIGKLSEDILLMLKENAIKYRNIFNLSHKEIYQEYVNCDMVSFISLHEGFGLPIIEANAVGRAVITSNLSSMPEVAGKSAHYVNPKNIEEIQQGILKLINDNEYRNKLIEEGFENVKKYSAEKIAKQYENLYLKIAKH